MADLDQKQKPPESAPKPCCPKCGVELVTEGRTIASGWKQIWSCPKNHVDILRDVEIEQRAKATLVRMWNTEI